MSTSVRETTNTVLIEEAQGVIELCRWILGEFEFSVEGKQAEGPVCAGSDPGSIVRCSLQKASRDRVGSKERVKDEGSIVSGVRGEGEVIRGVERSSISDLTDVRKTVEERNPRRRASCNADQ